MVMGKAPGVSADQHGKLLTSSANVTFSPSYLSP